MYGSNQWNQGQHFCGQQFNRNWYGYRRGYRKPFLFPALLLIGLLFWSGFIFKILFFVALFAVPAMLFARHYRDYGDYGYEDDGSKRKNDEKPKRGDDPYYQDIEII